MEHENGGDTNINWRTRHAPQRIGTGTGEFGNKRTSGNHPNYSIVEIGQNTKKSPGDFGETYCYSDSRGEQSADAGVKNSQMSKITVITFCKWLDSSIWLQNGTLTGTFPPG